jgi:hypothetical protein
MTLFMYAAKSIKAKAIVSVNADARMNFILNIFIVLLFKFKNKPRISGQGFCCPLSVQELSLCFKLYIAELFSFAHS